MYVPVAVGRFIMWIADKAINEVKPVLIYNIEGGGAVDGISQNVHLNVSIV